MTMLKALLILAIIESCHGATLSWTDKNPVGTTTYNVYRFTGTCASAAPTAPTGFTKIASALTVFTFSDSPAPGNYCYAVTAVLSGKESAFSNLVDYTQGPAPPVLTIADLPITGPLIIAFHCTPWHLTGTPATWVPAIPEWKGHLTGGSSLSTECSS